MVYEEFNNNYKDPLDVFFKATGIIRDEVKEGGNVSSPFHLMVADSVFD